MSAAGLLRQQALHERVEIVDIERIFYGSDRQVLPDHHVPRKWITDSGWVGESPERSLVVLQGKGDAGLLDEVGQQGGIFGGVKSVDEHTLRLVLLPDARFEVW